MRSTAPADEGNELRQRYDDVGLPRRKQQTQIRNFADCDRRAARAEMPVIRVILAVGSPLPVFLAKQTYQAVVT
jgi:hypothetical protein